MLPEPSGEMDAVDCQIPWEDGLNRLEFGRETPQLVLGWGSLHDSVAEPGE